MDVTIREHTLADSELHTAFVRLLPQLSRRSSPPSEEHLRRIAGSPAVQLLCAHHPRGGIVGTLSLVLIPLPSGLRARVEDVVVDETVRGLGVGRALLSDAVERAVALGARDLDLTSRPERTEAVHLYEALGFEQRQTRVYRHALKR